MRTILVAMEDRVSTVAGHAEPAALAARLRVAGWRFARRMRRESAPGISPTLSAALHTVETQGPITAGQLAAHEHVQKPTMTRTIQAMLDRGLVEHNPDLLEHRVTLPTSLPGSKRVPSPNDDSMTLRAHTFTT